MGLGSCVLTHSHDIMLLFVVMGYCSGLAFRKASRAAAVVIGVGFMGLQGVKSLGYIDVDWNKVKQDAIKPLDANEDGVLDEQDAQIWWKKSQTILKDGVPGVGGFSAGFLLGARRG